MVRDPSPGPRTTPARSRSDRAGRAGRISAPVGGDYADEMQRDPITSDEADHLLSGRSARDDLSDVVSFVRSASALRNARPDAATQARHLAAMSEATHLDPEPGYAPRSRSSVMVGSILRTKIFKVLAGAVAGVVAMGGLAAAHTLPAPAQDVVSAVAELIGIDLPRSNEKADKDKKVKTGADHDGDGVADDNGLHTGTTGTKRGADHDGDGVADDNGHHKGQTTEKRGKDHDGDGVADDNGLRKGDDGDSEDDDADDDADAEGDDDADDEGEDEDDEPKAERSDDASDRSKDARDDNETSNDDD